MKKFLALLLSMAMVLTLAACGGGNNGQPDSSGTPGAGSTQGGGTSVRTPAARTPISSWRKMAAT